MKYYLVGIKGTGMSALALLLKELGNYVIGSDVDEYFFTESTLRDRNIKIYSFNEFQLNDTYIYIIGNAFSKTNVDVAKIISNNYTYYYYHDFIGNILQMEIIGVSGTHGKTTTTSFLYQMMDKKASTIIGDGTGSGYLKNNLLVLEACEYKNHFLKYHPSISIITNIELDHSDFFSNINDVISSFKCFINQSDLIIANGDDQNINKITCNRMIKVGMQQHNDIIFNVVEESKFGYKVYIKYFNEYIDVPYLGIHFVYDFILSFVTCHMLGITPNIDGIKLPKKRMEEKVYGETIIINDYAHHPTEIKALYDSVKLKYYDYKINVIFQPHTYSRTLKFKKEFKKVLSLFDNVYIEKVFTSKREGINKFKQMKIDKIFNSFNQFNVDVLKLIKKDKKEIWIFLGAGNVDNYINMLE